MDNKIFEVMSANSPMFGTVRLIPESHTLFCGADVAKPLGYKNISQALRDNCRCVSTRYIPHPQNPEKQIEMLFIPEGDVYRLIARSKLPAAEQFERWIFDEVLPSIRKHGAYATPHTIDQILNDPDFGIRLLTELKNERDKNQTLTEEHKKLTAQIEADRPKVIFADSVSVADTTILIGEQAKILKQNGVPNMGQNRFFAWLRGNGYLISRAGTDYNMPTQKSMELGLFAIKESTITHSDGHVTINKTVKVTGKGQQYFANLFLSKKREAADVSTGGTQLVMVGAGAEG